MMDVIFNVIVPFPISLFTYVSMLIPGLKIVAGDNPYTLLFSLESIYKSELVYVMKENLPCGSVVGGDLIELMLKENCSVLAEKTML